jgi:hypothetical protein
MRVKTRLPWSSIVKVRFVVVIFGIPTIDGLVRECRPPRPLSREELYSLGGYEAMRDYCNWQIEGPGKLTIS